MTLSCTLYTNYTLLWKFYYVHCYHIYSSTCVPALCTVVASVPLHTYTTQLLHPVDGCRSSAQQRNSMTRCRCGPLEVQFPQFSFREVYLIPRVFFCIWYSANYICWKLHIPQNTLTQKDMVRYHVNLSHLGLNSQPHTSLCCLFTHQFFSGAYCSCSRRDGQAELAWVAGYIPRLYTHLSMVTYSNTKLLGHWLTLFVVVEMMLLLDCAGLHARDNMRCVRVYRRVIVKHFGS